MNDSEHARALLHEFKGDGYRYGFDILPDVGKMAAPLGRQAVIVRGTFPGSDDYGRTVSRSLERAGVGVVTEIAGARPNTPREDVERIASTLQATNPDVIVSLGGGSVIDAAKAAEVLNTLGAGIDEYFGTGKVRRALTLRARALASHVAIQTAASSAAHLTRYANVTDLETGQKKMIVDEAIVPERALFDYALTFSQPAALTADGAMGGLSHALEVMYGAVGDRQYARIREVATTAISLIVHHLPQTLDRPERPTGREALALGTDLGGYATMLGDTGAAHLTSFALVDVLSHGRACAILNPYYSVFFAPAIQDPLRALGGILREAGYASPRVERYSGRDLGLAVAEAMLEFAEQIGFPTRLSQVEGLTDAHIARALAAAKDPQLKFKLENMPVPLTADRVDDTLGPVLEAAREGALEAVPTIKVG